MQYLILLALFLALAVADPQVTVVAVANIDNHVYTQLTVAESPSADAPDLISVKGARYNLSDTTDPTVEAAAFTVQTPATGNSLGLYFGYFAAEAEFNITAKSASFSASLVELATSFYYLFVYYNNDGQPGFQYTIGNSLTCDLLFPVAGQDCIDWSNSIQLSSLTWNPIAVNKIACPSGYSASCNIYEFVLTDTTLYTSFTYKIASQPVFIDSYLVTPDYAKLDISISYPWSSPPSPLLLQANPQLGLLGATGGKTASLAATIAKASGGATTGNPGVVFTASGKVGAFSWDTTATVTAQKKRTTDSTVYFDVVYGQNLTDYTGANVLLLLLKADVGALELLGWKVAFLLFSWDAVEPSNVLWDPTQGLSESTPTYTAAPNAGVRGAEPVVWGMVFSVVMAFVCRWM